MKTQLSISKKRFFEDNPGYMDLFHSFPLGSGRKIREIIKNQHPGMRIYSIGHINGVLNPDDKRWNLEIVKVAVAYLKELKATAAKIKTEIDEIIA